MSEILVVSSKVKAFIKEHSGGMNVSASTMEALSRIVQKNVKTLLNMPNKMAARR